MQFLLLKSFAKNLEGGMMSQDIFIEVSHGPTLIDNNIMLSEASVRFAAQGVALVHNLICGALTAVGEGTGAYLGDTVGNIDINKT